MLLASGRDIDSLGSPLSALASPSRAERLAGRLQRREKSVRSAGLAHGMLDASSNSRAGEYKTACLIRIAAGGVDTRGERGGNGAGDTSHLSTCLAVCFATNYFVCGLVCPATSKRPTCLLALWSPGGNLKISWATARASQQLPAASLGRRRGSAYLVLESHQGPLEPFQQRTERAPARGQDHEQRAKP